MINQSEIIISNLCGLFVHAKSVFEPKMRLPAFTCSYYDEHVLDASSVVIK